MDALISHAIKHAWSSPDKHAYVALSPERVSSPTGVFTSFQTEWESIALPASNWAWNIYQFGGMLPEHIHLPATDGSWYTLASIAEECDTLVSAYSVRGIELCKSRTFMTRTKGGNMLLAVESNPAIPFQYRSERVYVRCYHTTYRQGAEPTFRVGGGLLKDAAQVSALLTEVANYKQSPTFQGGFTYFVNGFKVQQLSAATIKPGDAVDYVYDRAVFKVTDHSIPGLRTFQSTKDKARKYVLFDTSTWDGSVDYVDDCEFFVVDQTSGKAVTLHRNNQDAIRMLTFKDFSVKADYVRELLKSFVTQAGTIDLSKVFIRVHYRRVGAERTVFDDLNKITYLLKLPAQRQIDAVAGANATAPCWAADSLESSRYTELLGAEFKDINLDLVGDAYGYSACSEVVSDNFVDTLDVGGVVGAPVPVAMLGRYTAYEHDADGKLLGFYPIESMAEHYLCANSNCRLVEFVDGLATQMVDEVIGEQDVVVAGKTFRCYMRKRAADGSIDQRWSDVTGTSAYTVKGNSVVWERNSNRNKIVRADTDHLAYTVSVKPRDGVISHAITYTRRTGEGGVEAAVAVVPFGECDFWLNGYPLVKGIDYATDGTTVIITSMEYLVDRAQAQTLVVRARGFCTEDLKERTHYETGYIVEGMLSYNSVYGVFSNKALRVVCGGKLLRYSELNFKEDNQLSTVPGSSAALKNGRPFAIREMLNPLRGFTTKDPYALYDKQLSIDKQVSDYLTENLPKWDTTFNQVDRRYRLYSPFLGKIAYALQTGAIFDERMLGSYTDDFVRSKCTPYLSLLALDPVNDNNTPDLTIYDIYPHWWEQPMQLTLSQYRFFERVTQVYAKDKVSLRGHFSVV